MKKYVKIVSLILALIMTLAVFSACGQKEDEKEDPKDSVADTKDVQTSDTQTEATTKVPDIGVIDWDGREYRILAKDHAQYDIFTSFEVWRQEMTEDVVGKAVWKRNQDILENYGIDVVGYLKQDCNSIASTTLESGEDIYDLMILSPEAFNPFAMKGQLYNIYELDFVNTNHDAWMPYPNEQLTMGGRLYYTTNKFLIQDKNRYWGMFYNRDMANELNLGHFEDMVFDGTWTIDNVIELAKKGTYELDGQPGLGKRDNWGVCANPIDFFANKIKQIIKIEIDDGNNSGLRWDRTCSVSPYYIHGHVTVGDCYELYEMLKGRDTTKYYYSLRRPYTVNFSDGTNTYTFNVEALHKTEAQTLAERELFKTLKVSFS